MPNNKSLITLRNIFYAYLQQNNQQATKTSYYNHAPTKLTAVEEPTRMNVLEQKLEQATSACSSQQLSGAKSTGPNQLDAGQLACLLIK